MSSTKLLSIRDYSDVKILNVKVQHQDFCRVEKYTLQTRTFGGEWTSAYTRELITKRFAVAALPYDPITDQVVLIEQFRAGALEWRSENPADGANNNTPWLLEVVAGLMDKENAETPEELIRREMREEASLEILALLPMYEYLVSPGILTERIKLYCAAVDASHAPAFSGLAHEHEDIRVHVVSAVDAFAAVRSGRINNSAAIIALQWLELNLKSAREKLLKLMGTNS